MVNKIGILNGIFLFLLNFFAVIPLGIYFSSGISSYTGIPLYLVYDNNLAIFVWGTVLSTTTPSLWLIYGSSGWLRFILIQVLMVLALILTFIGSFVKTNKGKKILLAALIMIIITTIYVLIDVLFYKIFGTITLSIDNIFLSLGMGFYLLIIVIILQIGAIRTHTDIPED